MIKIANYINDSIVDGPGIRFTIFFQGCKHECDGCFNKETWDFSKGEWIEESKLMELILANPLLNGVTFSGGDPFYQVEGALKLAKMIKEHDLDLICYTGFLYEELINQAKNDSNLKELLSLIDILIDGPFIKEEKSIALLYRGSKNQRIIDVKKSLQEDKVVLKEFSLY